MKTTYGNITQSLDALRKLMRLELKVGEAVKLSKLIKAIDEEMKIFDDVRIKLCEKYGKRDADGGYKFTGEKKKIFLKELSELFETAVEFSFEKIKIGSDIKIDAASVMSLADFIRFGEEEDG